MYDVQTSHYSDLQHILKSRLHQLTFEKIYQINRKEYKKKLSFIFSLEL